MSADPRVSVVMPAYGQAAFVPRAVTSVLAQEMERWELIVVDDGSPDGTADAVASFLRDGRIRFLRRERNGGLGVALNEGLDAARASLIA
jgi:glycosyltransferase involved in cell wall biosynthesis